MMAPFADAKTARGVAKADVCPVLAAHGAASAISNIEICIIYQIPVAIFQERCARAAWKLQQAQWQC